jgi:hypothetical protein
MYANGSLALYFVITNEPIFILLKLKVRNKNIIELLNNIIT